MTEWSFKASRASVLRRLGLYADSSPLLAATCAQTQPPDRPPSTWKKLSCGATAGAISQTVSEMTVRSLGGLVVAKQVSQESEQTQFDLHHARRLPSLHTR